MRRITSLLAYSQNENTQIRKINWFFIVVVVVGRWKMRARQSDGLHIYPVPKSDFPLRSQRNVTGKSPSKIWQEIAARIPSFSIFVIDWIGIIFGGTVCVSYEIMMTNIWIFVLFVNVSVGGEEQSQLTQYLNLNVPPCRLFLLVLRHARVCASVFGSLQLFNYQRAVVVGFLPTING